MNDLIFEPVLPWPALAVAAFVAAVVFAWSARRGVRSPTRAWTLILLRLVALAAVCAVLAQPGRRADVVTVVRPQLAVLVDASGSMTDPVDPAQPTRAERVRQWLAQPALADARKDFDVRVFSFDQTVIEQPKGLQAIAFNGTGSNLAGALAQTRERFRGQPLAAILMLTDGLDTTGAAAAKPEAVPPAGSSNAGSITADAAANVPVCTFELETRFTPKSVPRKVSLAGVDFPPRVNVNWDAEIRVNLAARGLNGQTTAVELWREGRRLRAGAATFNEDEQTRQVTFVVSHDHAGRIPYEVRLADPALADKDAGVFPFAIDALEPGNRVIYLQNTLGFDFKYLRKAILGDHDLQLSAFTRWGDGRIVGIAQTGGASGTGALDFTDEALSSCVVVILGDIGPEALPPGGSAAIRRFVDHGGGLVLLGGPKGFAASFEGTPFAGMLPVRTPAAYREGNFPLDLTATGSHHPVFGGLFSQIKDFPALLTCNVSDEVSPTAETLLETELDGRRKPMIVASRFGKGRVVMIMSDTLWRWRLASRGWSASDRSPYDAFWAQLMDWLAPKEQDKSQRDRLDLFAERPHYLFGEKPEIRAVLRSASATARPPATVPLQVRTPNGKTFDYVMLPANLPTGAGGREPGYRVEVDPNVPGVFRVDSKVVLNGVPVEGEARFLVTRPLTEITGQPINREFLQTLAASNGGKYFEMKDWDQWRASLHVAEQRFSRVELQDLWNHPVLLGVLFATLAAEWIVRKFNNLP